MPPCNGFRLPALKTALRTWFLAACMLTGMSLAGYRPARADSGSQGSLLNDFLLKDFRKADKGRALDSIRSSLERVSGKDPAGHASDWLGLAILQATDERNAEAEESWNRFRQSWQNRPGIPGPDADRLLYQSYRLSFDELYNQAADSLLASIALRKADESSSMAILAESYGQLARLYKRNGDLAESLRNFERSMDLNRRLGRSISLAGDLTDLSDVISRMNRSDSRADSVLSEALSIFKKARDTRSVAQVYNELGVLFDRRFDPRRSLNYFKQSLVLKSSVPGLGRKEFIRVSNNIGACYLYLQKPDSSRFYFLKAAQYALEAGENPAPYYINLGASYGLQEQYDRSIEFFQKALNVYDPEACRTDDLSTNPRVAFANPRLADYTAYKAHSYHRKYHRSRNPDDLRIGLETFLVALGMIDTLRFMYSFDSKPYLSSAAKIHFFGALDMALDLHRLTNDPKYLNLAFRLSERNKSATLNEFLRTNQAREYLGSVSPWIREEDSVKQAINRLESILLARGAAEAGASEETSSMRNNLSDLKDRLRSLEARARRDHPDFFQLVYANRDYSPEEIRSLLKPDEALIDYTVVRDARLDLDPIIIMVLTRDTLFTCRDTLPRNFRRQIREFRETISPFVDAALYADFTRLSREMYRHFLEPVGELKGIRRLILLPDEELGFIPFETFIRDSAPAGEPDFRKLDYLNRRYQVSYISSHEQFYQFRTAPSEKADPGIQAFAPFVSQGVRMDSLDLMALENSGTELQPVSKFFSTRILSDQKAGELSLRKALEAGSVVSISTHGIMDTLRPMQSRLILNPSEPDGNLYLFEMISMKIRSPLVVLNACNTGVGKLQAGEGILSMARGFQLAGVPTVITTLWPIDDQSSALIMRLFFRNLREGLDQGEALMRARNSFIDQASKAGAAPYFWAGQVLIGDPDRISIRQRFSPILGAVLLLIVAAGLVFLFLNKKKQ